MEEHERQLVVDQLTASRERLLALVDGLTAEQWTFRPAEDRWSVAECLEHVTRVENRVLGIVLKKLEEQAPAEDPGQPNTRVEDALLARAIPDRTLRRQAPEPALPTGEWADANELVAEFRKTRQRTTEFAATTQRDLRRYFHPHGAFGELDCYQWLIVLSLHGSRHAQQIEEVQASSGFPRATASPASA